MDGWSWKPTLFPFGARRNLAGAISLSFRERTYRKIQPEKLAATILYHEKTIHFSHPNSYFQGNYYTRERRLFEMEARRLGAEKRGQHGGRTRRVREEDGVKVTWIGKGGENLEDHPSY